MKKTLNFIVLIMAALVLVSCESNVPELNDHNRQLLIGRWEVVKETVTNGDGFGGVFTRQVNDNMTLSFTESFLQPVSPTGYYLPGPYTLRQQDNGTWLLTVEGYYDRPRNLEGGRSPITIHKLTRTNMEWEFESYGGDEGPVVYYQYLKKLNLPVNNQQ